MKPQYQHNVTTSFALWLDNYLLSKGEAYTNQTGKFYYYSDPRISSTYKVFGSPHKQWVFDSAITGANIPSGVHVSGVFKGRNNGVILDFINGRALISGAATGVNVTGSYAVKDFNIYLSNENEEDLILENNIEANSKFPWTGSYIQPYDESFPAIYILSEGNKNTPFSFGGEDETRSLMRGIVFAESVYQLDATLSLFADTAQKAFKLKEFSDFPITEYGDIKSGSYTYDDYYSSPNVGAELFVDDVTVSKLKDRSKIGSKAYVGFLDFEIIKYRYPRL
jgi:hypothetical protein